MKVQEFEAHPVWSTLEALQSEIEELPTFDGDDGRHAAQRLHSAAEFADALRGVDPALMEPQGPNDLNAHLTQILTSVRNYKSNPQAHLPHLMNASAKTSGVMASARQWFPAPTADEATRAVKAAATRYRNMLDAEVERLRGEVENLRTGLEEEQTKRRAAEVDAKQELEGLKSKIGDASTQVDALTAKLNRQIDNQRTAFEDEAAQRSTAFKESEHAREVAEAERIEGARLAAQTAQEEQIQEAASALAKLRDHETRAAALVDTTSRHAIAGDYGTWAAKQARAAFWWTVTTVIIGLGTVAGLVVTISSASDDSIQFTAYKASISAIGLIVAGYAARQASEHRGEERTAKRLALDLAALEPFLGNVENPEELRTEIARRVFVPVENHTSDGDTRLRTRRGSLSLKELTELVTAFR